MLRKITASLIAPGNFFWRSSSKGFDHGSGLTGALAAGAAGLGGAPAGGLGGAAAGGLAGALGTPPPAPAGAGGLEGAPALGLACELAPPPSAAGFWVPAPSAALGGSFFSLAMGL